MASAWRSTFRAPHALTRVGRDVGELQYEAPVSTTRNESRSFEAQASGGLLLRRYVIHGREVDECLDRHAHFNYQKEPEFWRLFTAPLLLLFEPDSMPRLGLKPSTRVISRSICYMYLRPPGQLACAPSRRYLCSALRGSPSWGPHGARTATACSLRGATTWSIVLEIRGSRCGGATSAAGGKSRRAPVDTTERSAARALRR